MQLPLTSRHRAAAALALAFLVLAALVAAGELTGLDQRAVDGAMPAASRHPGTATLAGSLVPRFHTERDRPHPTLALAAYAVTLPASIVPSALAVLAVLLLLWRRGRRLPALAWGLAFAAANVVELIGKSTIARPALYRHVAGRALHIVAFDDSFPSGHTIRSIVLAALVAWIWPRARPWAALAALAVAAMLEVGGYHTPSDIAGGALLAGALVLAASASASRAAVARVRAPHESRERAAGVDGEVEAERPRPARDQADHPVRPG